MKVLARLQYVKLQPDGTEQKMSIPNNFPDAVEMDVPTMEHVGKVVLLAVHSHAKLHGCVVPPDTAIKYTAEAVPNPINN